MKNMFSGLNEMLESEVSLDVCLGTVKLLMSEDRYVAITCEHVLIDTLRHSLSNCIIYVLTFVEKCWHLSI